MVGKRREVSKEARGRQLHHYRLVRLLHSIISDKVHMICLRSTSFRNTPKPLDTIQEYGDSLLSAPGPSVWSFWEFMVVTYSFLFI